jgi:3-oxoacyl-[acyl-carrier protein] reductase
MNVLITGGSRGIGNAIMKKYSAKGHTTICPTRSELDLSDKESVAAFVKKYESETFDCIINNAGINPLNLIEDISDDDLYDCIQVNLIAPALLVKGFVRGMIKKNRGYIVNIGSIWGVVSKEKRSAYAMSKNGIHGLTNTLAIELGQYNILVNTVCPGFTKTELTAQNISPELEKKLCEDIPLGRFAQPEEIAEVVYWLGSEDNKYLTGQKVVVDGGFTVR